MKSPIKRPKIYREPGTMQEYGWYDESLEKEIRQYLHNNPASCRHDALIFIFGNI